MIGTIRKHQQWLWGIIILAIIVSFVVYFSPNRTGIFDDAGSYNFGSIKGRPITRDEFRDAQSEIVLFHFLRSGKWPTREELEQKINPQDPKSETYIERETYHRIVLIQKLKELNVQPSSDAIAQWVAEVFQGKDAGPFPMEKFNDFVKNELAPHGYSADDFYRFARHQVGQQHLISVYGMSGKLIAPQEAETFYRQLNEPLSTEAVFFSATNFLNKVSATPENLSQFYSNNMAEYRLPERVQVNYVKWDATNFLAEADKELGKETNLAQKIEMAYGNYLKNAGTNQFKDESGKPLSAEAAKNKIKEDQRERLALIAAQKAANDFITELFDGHDEKKPFQPDDLENLAKSKKLELKTTPPFSETTSTNELKLPASFIRTAFNLRNDDPEDKARELLYASRPVIGEKAVYAIGFKQRFPSEIQPFDKVREQVTKDYREEQSIKLARNAGIAFEKTLTNSLAQGKTFEAIVKEAGLTAVSLPQFSLSSRTLPGLEHVNIDTLQNVATTLSVGKTSDFIATAVGGFVLHLKAKLPVDEARLKAELPEFLARQRDQRMSAAFTEWFEKLDQEMNLEIPTKATTEKK